MGADCSMADSSSDCAGDVAAMLSKYAFEAKLVVLTAFDCGGVIDTCTQLIANAEYDEKSGSYQNYKPHTVYNGENEGLFNYEKASTKSGMSGGGVFGIILLIAVVGGGAAAFLMNNGVMGD